jgi:hypothetical protein
MKVANGTLDYKNKPAYHIFSGLAKKMHHDKS